MMHARTTRVSNVPVVPSYPAVVAAAAAAAVPDVSRFLGKVKRHRAQHPRLTM